MIPQRVGERVGLKPGTKLQVINFDDRIELVPVRPIEKAEILSISTVCLREVSKKVIQVADEAKARQAIALEPEAKKKRMIFRFWGARGKR